ncbi:hypothetical protein [Pedobacter cryotolerans]|uniref:Uncharacterized protein n=1 Tax=Pedobacter cryotolerans TaxID=2571270 RepID=A0A4U1CBF4_9SPHI|nr:hypothetical protein [Pedobacter cryotolerans]TKC03386.1 hypothetical protein FA045_02115 [Pedobacter cryotolerans]
MGSETPPAILLEKAKLFYNKQTTTLPKVSSANQGGSGNKPHNTKIENKKTPIWAEAKMEKTKDGKTVMTVPLEKYELNNKDIDYARKYIFEERDGEITDGKVIEVIGATEIINEKGESTVTRYKDKQIEGFSGAMISYNLNYSYLEGHYYKEGRQVPGTVRITSKLPNTQSKGGLKGKLANANIPNKLSTEITEDGSTITCSSRYLHVYYYDQYGDYMFSTVTYLGEFCSGPTGPVGPPPVGGVITETVVYDCAGEPNGTASDNNPCNICMGGNTGITACPRILKEIKVDSTARPCVDTIATKIISEAGEIQNVLSDLLSMANLNASASISTIANSGTFKIKIGEHLFNDQTKYDAAGNSFILRRNGVTNDTTGYIHLNKLMLNEATDLAVAATLIHELMHSYMVYGIHHTSGLEHDIFAGMNTFLFDQSGTPYSNQGIPQHTQMANTYVNSMASLLTRFAISRGILTSPDSSISLTEYCQDIFWQNLQHSQAYIAAPNKNRSTSNGNREYKNTSNSSKKKKC